MLIPETFSAAWSLALSGEALTIHMHPTVLVGATVLICAMLAGVGYQLSKRKTIAIRRTGLELNSTPDYYGWYAVVAMFMPAAFASVVILTLETTNVLDVPNTVVVASWIVLPLVALALVMRRISAKLNARVLVERVIYAVLLGAALISILTTAGILLSVLFESVRFFEQVNVFEFLTGTTWSPGGAFLEGAGRGDEQGTETEFGAVKLFYGTLLITAIAMLVAAPLGLLSAIYMSEYASKRVRRLTKPILEMLAGIPTVVYGFFAAITVAPLIVDATSAFGVSTSYQNAIAPGIIMGVMIIPFMSSLCDDVMSSVPQNIRRASYAMGSTKAETVKKIVLPAALPGVISAFLLSVSRAIGETMIVVMAAGYQANWSPLNGSTTVTVHIVANMTGDKEYDNLQTLSAFSLGLTLLLMTLALNVISAVVIRKFRQRYEGD